MPKKFASATTNSASGNNMMSPVPAITSSSPDSMIPSRSSSFCGCSHSAMFSTFFEYETPKVVTVQNVPLGILRLLLQILVNISSTSLRRSNGVFIRRYFVLDVCLTNKNWYSKLLNTYLCSTEAEKPQSYNLIQNYLMTNKWFSDQK